MKALEHNSEHPLDGTPRPASGCSLCKLAVSKRPPPEKMRWLSVDQIRKQQRMRRETVRTAMLSGDLPFEQRGRIRYARECDVRAWEEKRLKRGPAPRLCEIHPDLLRYV